MLTTNAFCLAVLYGIKPRNALLRYNKEEKKRVSITCPAIVWNYNKSMGGVDKNNCLVSLYRGPCKSRRWYLPIFFYFLDMCVSNAWLLFRSEQKGTEKSIPLKNFRLQLAAGLLHCGKEKRKRKAVDNLTPKEKIRIPRAPIPDVASRYDTVGHWTIT